MKKFLIGLLALTGALSILALIGLFTIGLLSVLARPGVPSRTVLEIDFEGGVIEAVPDDAFAQLMLDDQLKLRDVIDALDRGAEDRRVKGLVAKIGSGGMGLAHIQEIRDAVKRFRDAGKPAIAFAETFGEFAPGTGGYYLATAFDEIHLQPSGDIGLTGLMYESTFMRGTYDKLDIEPRMGQRHEYKNAMNTFTETAYTEPHREAMQRLVDSQFGQMVRDIAAARGLAEDVVRERVDRGPYLAQEALDAELVDRLSYRDQVYDAIGTLTGEDDPDFLSVTAYVERAGRPNSRGTTVALIHGYGAVTRGPSSFSPFDGSITMGSDSVAGALRDAIDDRRVRAIILRVDSPGGSYVGSDSIWRETIRAKEAGKPVIVSMGNLAASGGYFVAMHADKIVAEPGTITASIGVLGGKLLTRNFWGKLGLTMDDVVSSANSTYFNASHDYTEAGQARFDASLDRIYEDFTSKVAEGRGLPLEHVRQVARGRIWTGEDAVEHGLVDALGGVDVALKLAREALDLEADADIRLKRMPPVRSAWELLFPTELNVGNAQALRAVVESLEPYQPAIRVLRELGVQGDRGTLFVPGLEVRH